MHMCSRGICVAVLVEVAWLLPIILWRVEVSGWGMQAGGRLERGGLGMEVRLRRAVMSAAVHGVPSTRTCRIER